MKCCCACGQNQQRQQQWQRVSEKAPSHVQSTMTTMAEAQEL
jgi:hypothetical protein